MRIGLGTAAIGRPHYINIKTTGKEEALFNLNNFRQKGLELIDFAYQQGVRHFDTAPGYGIAEDLLIDWFAEKKNPRISISTKWGYTYVANFEKAAKVHEVKEHSIDKLKEQWNTSKKLLPVLNNYQIHSATLETGVLENIEVLNQLASLKEKFGFQIGITTSGANQIEVLKKAINVKVNKNPLFDTFQVTYNVLDQNLFEILQALSKEKKQLIIKEALANGRVFRNKKFPHYQKLYTTLEELAKKYQVGIDAIALRFCIDTVPQAMVLSGASTKEQLKQNLKAEVFQLTTTEIEKLKTFRVSPDKYWAERSKLSWN